MTETVRMYAEVCAVVFGSLVGMFVAAFAIVGAVLALQHL